MKKNGFLKLYILIVFAGLTVFMPFLSAKTSGASAQSTSSGLAGFGNRITGYVFGFQRTPVDRAEVELLNEYQQTIQRTRTNGSGLYVFAGMPAGRYIVRVLPFITDYEEQEQETEIVNIPRGNNPLTGASGGVSAYEHKQMDFYLKTRQGALTGSTGAIFAQDVPKEARELYEKGLEQLRENKQKEGLQNIKTAIEKFPTYYYALETLGTEYVRLKYYQPALALLATAVEVNPRAYKSWYGLAYSFSAVGQAGPALTSAQKAVELNPNSVEALLIHGVILRQNKKYEEAEKQYIKARGLNIKSYMPQIHLQLGVLYGDMKRYADAVRELKLYLKISPNGSNNDEVKKRIRDFEAQPQKS